jgi:hypothetical protein
VAGLEAALDRAFAAGGTLAEAGFGLDHAPQPAR